MAYTGTNFPLYYQTSCLVYMRIFSKGIPTDIKSEILRLTISDWVSDGLAVGSFRFLLWWLSSGNVGIESFELGLVDFNSDRFSFGTFSVSFGIFFCDGCCCDGGLSILSSPIGFFGSGVAILVDTGGLSVFLRSNNILSSSPYRRVIDFIKEGLLGGADLIFGGDGWIFASGAAFGVEPLRTFGELRFFDFRPDFFYRIHNFVLFTQCIFEIEVYSLEFFRKYMLWIPFLFLLRFYFSHFWHFRQSGVSLQFVRRTPSIFML